MALPPAFLDELRARTPIGAVVGRRVKLARSGRQWKGCCPFHGEKTPSFYVYDDHFHCFGCGAHGDAISFVMQSQGAAFMEAVEQLAAEAGLDVPKPSPEAAEAERQRVDLAGVLDRAARAWQRRLRTPEGAPALAYLRGRGLSEETIGHFGLGWSGEGRGALGRELAADGITREQLIEAGLMRAADAERDAADLFFNRVMFPIRDRRGRIISFGGRTLGDGQPKYVNGPETPLFSKRRTLYGLDFAREGVRAGATVLAVEGYMDVIALHQAGLAGAVAPLGTALTEEQLSELWRLAPVPVLCFDGDAAGARAAARAAELALPLLGPERSLRIATLPPGEDPDTLVRRGGAAAMQAVLETARPLAEALFDLLREGAGSGTPEARAAFRKRLEDAAGRIPDRTLASEYRSSLLDRFFSERAAERAAGRVSNRGAPAKPRPVNGHKVHRPAISAEGAGAERARVLTAILLRHPDLLRDVGHAYEMLALPPPQGALRDAIFGAAETLDVLDSPGLMTHLAQSGLADAAAQIVTETHVPLPACARPTAMAAEAEAGWWHFFGLLDPGRLDAEIDAARQRMAESCDDDSQRRLVALVRARAGLLREPGEADP
jgi:DNA primase